MSAPRSHACAMRRGAGMRRRPVRAQRGMAVIAALLVVAIAAVLTAGLFQRQTVVMRAAENDQARAQARWLLTAGTDWARLILWSDGRRYATTRGDQLWATPIADMQVGEAGTLKDALFSGLVEDEQGKLNLNGLAAGGQIVDGSLASLQRLFALLSLPPELAERIARRVAAAQYRIDAAGTVLGAPTLPGLAAIDDLLGLDQVDARTLAVLRAYLTVLPAVTSINVNTASAEVLAAAVPGLSLSQARQLVLARERGQWFNDQADFVNRLGERGAEMGNTTLATTSEWFLVTGTVRIARADVRWQALLRRAVQQPPATVWLREL